MPKEIAMPGKNCQKVRDRLLAEEAATSEFAEHLAACPACAHFAARLSEARQLLVEDAGVRPDAAFAARVVSNLPGPVDVLGWAALRLLPAALALCLAVGLWTLGSRDLLAPLVPSGGANAEEALLTWLADAESEVP